MSEADQARTVLIVGASDKPDRTSYQLLERMRARGGYRPIPIHPRLKEIQGRLSDEIRAVERLIAAGKPAFSPSLPLVIERSVTGSH